MVLNKVLGKCDLASVGWLCVHAFGEGGGRAPPLPKFLPYLFMSGQNRKQSVRTGERTVQVAYSAPPGRPCVFVVSIGKQTKYSH